MIGLLFSIRKSRTDSEGRIFIEIEVPPQYRLKAAALAAQVKTLLVANFAPLETQELPEPPGDDL